MLKDFLSKSNYFLFHYLLIIDDRFGLLVLISILQIQNKFFQNLTKPLQCYWDVLNKRSPLQVGLFRKPGVRSRIRALRACLDSGEEVDLAGFGAFDVADVIKTYFRWVLLLFSEHYVSSLRDLRGAPEVPPLCRETPSLGQQILERWEQMG